MRQRADLLQRAILTAVVAHKDQVDKGGHPYILHPLRVMESGTTYDEKIVGVLHDVVEDTRITLADLALHFPQHIVDAVDAVSRRDGETYREFINRIERAGRLAVRVKLHDLHDNMSPKRMSALSSDEAVGMMKRYVPAVTQLEVALTGMEACLADSSI